MSISVFGLILPEEIALNWETSAHLLVAEMREGGAVDLMVLLESGTFRYLATIGCDGEEGVIEAPEPFGILGDHVRSVLDSNAPLVRAPSTIVQGFYFSIFPLIGPTKRVAVILEPQDSANA